MSTPQAKHPIKFMRPAVIEFRFNGRKAYERQLGIFKRALKPTAVFKKDSSCYFPIATDSAGTHKDLELRFVLLKKKQFGNTRTIVYWEVPSKVLKPSDGLIWTSDSLVKGHKFNVLEKIYFQPIDSSIQILLEKDSSGDASASKEYVNNYNNRTLGLVVNPPYPTLTLHDKGTTADSLNIKPKPAGEAGNSPNYFVWIGCVMALLIGFMVGRLGRK
jgi:hypothetical protein